MLYKKINLIIIILFLIVTSSFSQIPIGNWGNYRVSPITGDEGGYKIEINKRGNYYYGTYEQFAGASMGKVELKNVKYIEKEKKLFFEINYQGVNNKATITFLNKLALLKFDDSVSAKVITKDNSPLNLLNEDKIIFVKGPIYIKADKNSQKLKDNNNEETVKFIEYYNTSSDYFVNVEYKGKAGYALIKDFVESYPEVVTEDNVRFREKPSLNGRIIGSFKKETIIGIIGDHYSDDKWVRITYKGQKGWVYKDFVTRR